jgi:hypothetical protein
MSDVRIQDSGFRMSGFRDLLPTSGIQHPTSDI